MKRVSAVFSIIALLALPAAAEAAGRRGQESHSPAPVRVMSQNLYVGADIFRILDAGALILIPFVITGIVQTIFETDFPARAEVLADEIALTDPHLIGLQEVSLIRVQSPGDFLSGNSLPAEDVMFDYLNILLDALADRGLEYEVAGVVENADVELPMFAGFAGGMLFFDDIRLTDRDVILARSDVETSNVTARNYEFNLIIPIGDFQFELLRGFVGLDAKVDDRSYRFVNTHLETKFPLPIFQTIQGLELAIELAPETRPVILVGDLNSSPEDPFPRPYPLMRAVGYLDAWLHQSGPPDPGFTCCQAETLTNEVSLLDKRIDYVLVRNDSDFHPHGGLGPVEVMLFGANPVDKTESGLWPSDHAGVEAEMIISVQTP